MQGQLFRSKNQSCECQLHDEALRATLPGVREVFIGFSLVKMTGNVGFMFYVETAGFIKKRENKIYDVYVYIMYMYSNKTFPV